MLFSFFTPHIFINCYDPDRVNTRNFWVARLLCKVPGKCLCQILALSPSHKICGKMHASNHCLWVKQKPLLYAIVFHLNLVACGMEKLSQAIFPKQAGIKESPPIGIENATIDIRTSKTHCFAHFLLFAQPLTCEKALFCFSQLVIHQLLHQSPHNLRRPNQYLQPCNIQKAICKVLSNRENI